MFCLVRINLTSALIFKPCKINIRLDKASFHGLVSLVDATSISRSRFFIFYFAFNFFNFFFEMLVERIS